MRTSSRHLLQVLLVLVSILVLNMLLLVPQLHSRSSSWHIVGFSASSSSSSDYSSSSGGSSSGSGASKLLAATSSDRQQQQQMVIQQVHRQQATRVQGSSSSSSSRSSIAAGDFVGVFDANQDGVLSSKEFDSLVQVSPQGVCY